jgi:hypothetical protein
MLHAPLGWKFGGSGPQEDQTIQAFDEAGQIPVVLEDDVAFV